MTWPSNFKLNTDEFGGMPGAQDHILSEGLSVLANVTSLALDATAFNPPLLSVVRVNHDQLGASLLKGAPRWLSGPSRPAFVVATVQDGTALSTTELFTHKLEEMGYKSVPGKNLGKLNVRMVVLKRVDTK